VAQTHVAAQVQSKMIEPFSLPRSSFYTKYNIDTRPYPSALGPDALVSKWSLTGCASGQVSCVAYWVEPAISEVGSLCVMLIWRCCSSARYSMAGLATH
jgi:hypothetical protein